MEQKLSVDRQGGRISLFPLLCVCLSVSLLPSPLLLSSDSLPPSIDCPSSQPTMTGCWFSSDSILFLSSSPIDLLYSVFCSPRLVCCVERPLSLSSPRAVVHFYSALLKPHPPFRFIRPNWSISSSRCKSLRLLLIADGRFRVSGLLRLIVLSRAWIASAETYREGERHNWYKPSTRFSNWERQLEERGK